MTCFVHGVGDPFLAVGDAAREAAAAGGAAFTAGAYFIGKAVWGKVRGPKTQPGTLSSGPTCRRSQPRASGRGQLWSFVVVRVRNRSQPQLAG